MSDAAIPHLAQADALLLLARLLSGPSPDLAGRVEAARESLDELLSAMGAAERRGLWQEALAHARALDPEAWADEHTRLFEGPAPCPINETGYVRRDKGQILADVAGFYRAFGFRLERGSGEKLDHLVAELEFCALLLVMLARAEADPDMTEQADVTRDALAAFARDHLGEWVGGFAARLTLTTNLPFYAALARLLEGVWADVCDANGLPRPAGKRLACAEEDPGTPYECGLADAGLA